MSAEEKQLAAILDAWAKASYAEREVLRERWRKLYPPWAQSRKQGSFRV